MHGSSMSRCVLAARSSNSTGPLAREAAFDGCAALQVFADAPTPEARTEVMQALPRALAFAAPGALVHILSSRGGCERLEVYQADRWAKYTEPCWRDAVRKISRHSQRELLCQRSGRKESCMTNLTSEGQSVCDGKPLLARAIKERVRISGRARLTHPLSATGAKLIRTLKLGSYDVPLGGLLAATARYLTVVHEADQHRTCLLFKDGSRETHVVGACSPDGLAFRPELAVVADSGIMVGPRFRLVSRLNATVGRAEDHSMTHNLAVLRLRNGSYMIAGGTARGKRRTRGIRLLTRTAWHADGGTRTGDVVAGRLVMDGLHSGCTDRRIPKQPCYHCLQGSIAKMQPAAKGSGVCEYDGRLSLVFHRGRYLLYARANVASHGQRFVQVAASVDAYNWAPFQGIAVTGYNYTEGEIYFWLVEPNPLDNTTLIALLPLIHRYRGCVGISLSRDGVHWTKPDPLLRCSVHGERTTHHPAAGVVRRGRRVYIYVQEHVPGVWMDEQTPWPTVKLLRNRNPHSRVVRYGLPTRVWEEWTLSRRRDLE